MQLPPSSDSLSLRLRTLQSLTSLHNATRRSVLQKVRDRTSIVLSLLVNTGFQVLFHSPPGVLFTFPSQYYALSVTISYLGLGGGPPGFPPDSSCPAVLWCRLTVPGFRVRGFYSLWLSFPEHSAILLPVLCRSTTPESMLSGLASFPFARRYSGNHSYFLFLRVLRCFSSPGALRETMDSFHDDQSLHWPGSPIRISADQYLLAVPRSFSQLAASFFGVWCHGIHPVLFVA